MSNFLSSIKEHRLALMIVVVGLILVVTMIGITQPVTAEQGLTPDPQATMERFYRCLEVVTASLE